MNLKLAAFVSDTETRVDIHHNCAAFEEHFGKKVCVHRKGATSAKPTGCRDA